MICRICGKLITEKFNGLEIGPECIKKINMIGPRLKEEPLNSTIIIIIIIISKSDSTSGEKILKEEIGVIAIIESPIGDIILCEDSFVSHYELHKNHFENIVVLQEYFFLATDVITNPDEIWELKESDNKSIFKIIKSYNNIKLTILGAKSIKSGRKFFSTLFPVNKSRNSTKGYVKIFSKEIQND